MSSAGWMTWDDVPAHVRSAIQSSDGGHVADPIQVERITESIVNRLAPILLQRVEAGIERARFQHLVRSVQQATGESKAKCIQAVAIHCNRSPERVRAIYYGQD